MKVSEEPIIVEQSFKNSLEEVWSAITVLDKMRGWFFDNIENFEPEIGFKTSFAVQSNERTFTHLWEILDVIPNQKITYSWRYAEYPGDSTVTFELKELEKETHLSLTTEILADFHDDIPEFKRESCVQGWEYFIKGQLLEYLKK